MTVKKRKIRVSPERRTADAANLTVITLQQNEDTVSSISVDVEIIAHYLPAYKCTSRCVDDWKRASDFGLFYFLLFLFFTLFKEYERMYSNGNIRVCCLLSAASLLSAVRKSFESTPILVTILLFRPSEKGS